MQSLLIISSEPAVTETLASELTEFAVTGVRPQDAETYVHNENFCLVIIDNDTNYSIDNTIKNTIILTRPIRLSDAIYTIRKQVKSKTAISREETEFLPGYFFSAAERHIRVANGDSSVSLTDKEVDLLQQLTKVNTSPLSRDKLLKAVWGYGDDINTHTLETHIYRLRGKLKQLNDALDIVFSEEGGYRLK